MDTKGIFLIMNKMNKIKLVANMLSLFTVFSILTGSAQAEEGQKETERLAGDIFIHSAGYEVKLGSDLLIKTGLDDSKMKIIFLKTGKTGEISRELFTGLLERSEYGEWSINPDNWFEILKQSNLNPAPEGRGGYMGESSVVADFENIEYHPCKFDKAKGPKPFMECKKEGMDGNAYGRIVNLADLKKQDKELDDEITELAQDVKQIEAENTQKEAKGKQIEAENTQKEVRKEQIDAQLKSARDGIKALLNGGSSSS